MPHLLERLIGVAYLGVPMFFVASAFTLTIRTQVCFAEVPRYALRRLARIAPGYWLAGIAYTALTGLGPHLWAPNGITSSDIGIAFLFGGAWFDGGSYVVVPGGWSVSCEVTFYLALPFLLLAINGKLWRAILLAIAAWLVAQIYSRHATPAGMYDYLYYSNPIEQAPVFLLGVVAALCAQKWDFGRHNVAPACLILLAVFGISYSPMAGWHVLKHIQFAALVAASSVLSARHCPAILSPVWLQKIGSVSFSMYLTHFVFLAPCLWIAEHALPSGDLATMLLDLGLVLSVTFAFSSFTYRFIEQPPIRWAAAYLKNHPVQRRNAAVS